MIEIRRVGTERRHELVTTLAAAFAEDPFIGWLLAETPFEPAEAQLRWWTGALAAMEEVAVLHATQDSSAVAVWLPPRDRPGGSDRDGEPVEAPADGDEPDKFVALVQEVCGAAAGDRLAFLAELSAAVPDEPHWHLTAVAVAPPAQGGGLGRKVLTPLLDRCDRLGLPAYLEATTPRSRALYERLGFERISSLAPAGAPGLVLMWREPRR